MTLSGSCAQISVWCFISISIPFRFRFYCDSTAVRLPFDCNSTALRPFCVTTRLFWASALRSKWINKLCAWRHNMPPPLSPPPVGAQAPHAAEPSSSFPRWTDFHAHRCSRLTLSKAAWWPWPLTFWPWKWWPSHVWRGLPLRQF